MTKIDERKQYKFSEIIAMLENEELPKETNVSSGTKSFTVLKCMLGTFGLASNADVTFVEADITPTDINTLWTIKLPKEDKFYLKAPFRTKKQYLHYCSDSKDYFFHSTTNETDCCSNKFTQREIDAMTFDTEFFKKVKVGEAE